MNTQTDSAIDQAVEAKLIELDSIPYGTVAGRRLEFGGDNARANMAVLFRDVAVRLGVDFFQQVPAVELEQFAIMSVVKGHDTAGLLKSALNSFLRAYAAPETNDGAYECLLVLERMRSLIDTRRQMMHAAQSASVH